MSMTVTNIPDISIIIPVYNKLKYLDRILKLIQDQTFENFECLIIDDGSTDGSSEICDEYCNKDNRFKVFHTENKGVSHARNIGLRNIGGQYVTFIDADDEVNSCYLQDLYESIRLHNSDIAISSLVKMDEQGTNTKRIEYPLTKDCYSLKELLPDFCELQINYGIFGWCWGKLLKKELVENHFFNEDIYLAEDLDYYLDIYPRVNSLSYCNTAIYYYRQMAVNSSGFTPDNSIDYLTQLKINLKMKNYLVNEDVYSGNNQQLIDQRIQNYIYYWIFHSTTESFDSRYKDVCRIIEIDNLSLKPCKGFKKIVLSGVFSGKKQKVKVLLSIHRILRRVIHKA